MRLLTSMAITTLVAALAFGADPIGTASSSGSFDVNDVSMRSDGISSWPVMPGDEVSSMGSPVIIRFQDGSRITLDQQSQVKLASDGVSVNLTSGSAQFNLAPQSALHVATAGKPVLARSGAVSLRNQNQNQNVSQIGAPRADGVRPPPQPLSTK